MALFGGYAGSRCVKGLEWIASSSQESISLFQPEQYVDSRSVYEPRQSQTRFLIAR